MSIKEKIMSFREMKHANQQRSNEEAIAILQRGKSGVLALHGDNGYPYAVPISYVYHEGKIILHGAPAGDLYVNVRVKEHKIFERNGLDLHCELPISFAVAALGGEVEVPTLDGKVKLNIPKETQAGRRMRVKGKGIKSLRSNYFN